MLARLLCALILLVPHTAAQDGDATAERDMLRQVLAMLDGREMSAELVSAYEELHGRFWRLGDSDAAHAALTRIVPWWEQQFGVESATLATELDRLGSVLYFRADYVATRPLYERALAIREVVLGPDHVNVSSSLNNLAALLRVLGEHDAARPMFERSIAIDEATSGPGPDLAASLNNLALLHYVLGDYAAALPLHERALAMREDALGPDDVAVAESLGNLAVVHSALGDAATARPLYDRCLAILEQQLGPDHPKVAVIGADLAAVLYRLGNHAAALPMFERALAAREATLGPNDPQLAVALNNVAITQRALGDNAAARPLHERALAIREAAFGPEHTEVSVSLNNLGNVLVALGDHAAARPLLERSLAIKEAALGSEHPAVASTLEGLGALLRAIGDHAAATAAHERSLAIRAATLGEQHPFVATNLRDLLLLALDAGRPEQARTLARRLAEHGAATRRTMATLTAGECHILLAHQREARDALLAARATDPAAAYATVLDSKGQVARLTLSTRAQLRAALGPETLAMMDGLSDAQARLSQLALRTTIPDREAHAQQLEALRVERDDLDRQLRRQVEWSESEALEPSDVAASLPRGSALVDLLVHPTYVPARRADGVVVEAGRWSEPRVSAWVLRAGDATVRHVDLGPVAAIEAAVGAFLGALLEGDRPGAVAQRGGRLGSRPADTTAHDAPSLRALVWDPLAEHLAGVDQVLLSPDGVLGTLPFETLRDAAGRYLIEDLAIVYVSDGGALVRGHGPPAGLGDSLLTVGGVDYDRREGDAAVDRASATPIGSATSGGASLSRGFAESWQSLPATAAEAQALATTHATAVQGGARQLLRGAAATEERLKRELPRHAIAHLATHGYFQPAGLPSAREAALDAVRGQSLAASAERLTGLHPGLLSGLVLAGANRPPDDPAAVEDGFLTASEVTLLDLSGVDMVVLSACETGLGRPAAGEGLLGLRRAFHMAGADTVVSSLWAVQDASTARLMQAFHRNLLTRGMGRHAALRAAQLQLLEANRREQGLALPSTWGAFILSGEWR